MSIFTCKLCLKQQEILYVRGERTVAISGVLLEGRITFKTYVDKGEGGGCYNLKILGGTSFMDGP